MIYLILSITVFTAYFIYIVVVYGVQKSISESYYRLIEDKNIKGLLFILTLWCFSITVSISASNVLIFFAAAAICFTGTAPAFRSGKMEEKVHTIGAMSGVVLGYAYLLVNWQLYIIIPSLLLCAIITTVQTKRIKQAKQYLEKYGGINALHIFPHYYSVERNENEQIVNITYKDTYIWWVETIAFYSICLGVFFNVY